MEWCSQSVQNVENEELYPIVVHIISDNVQLRNVSAIIITRLQSGTGFAIKRNESTEI